MTSIFEKIRKGEQGMYDPTRRYSLTNKTGEPFDFKWNGVVIDMKVDETIELPQYLAYLATNKMIDQMMMGKMKEDLDKARAVNPAYIAPNGAGMLGVPNARIPYEQMIIKELPPKSGNEAQLEIIRVKELVLADIKRSKEETKPIETVVVQQSEFSELKESAPVMVQ